MISLREQLRVKLRIVEVSEEEEHGDGEKEETAEDSGEEGKKGAQEEGEERED